MRRVVTVVLLLAAAASAGAQSSAAPLTLSEALRRADGAAFANRGARAMASAQRAEQTAALRGILPSVRVEAGYVRTTDPIGAFGTTLRQRIITQNDFSPPRLNNPAAVANYAGGLVLEQPVFNGDAWAGRRVARLAMEGTHATTEWTATGVQVDVIKAYYGAVLAVEKARTLRSAVAAAREHVRLAESMEKNGLVTTADALMASVKAGEAEVMLAAAEGDLLTARVGLATLLGNAADSGFMLPPGLPTTGDVRRIADPTAASEKERGDLRAARAGVEAAETDAQRAMAAYLPRLNGFARYDWNSALRPFGGDKNWTVGVMATWTPFAGASEVAERSATRARLAAAQAARDGAVAHGALELARTETALRVALQRLDIVERMVRQSADAHRIVARRYEGGLAPVVELLDAQAAELNARLAHSAARFDVIAAAAERHRASGNDPAELRVLDSTTATPTTEQ